MNEEKKYCILVVDDEVHNISILNDILSPLYMIKTAKNGQTAIKIAEKFKPDIILLDIIMPDLSGFEVITQLKESAITREIPVIFITGLDNSQNEEKGLLLGAVDYITKPFNISIVKLRVSTHLKIIEQMRTIERLGMIDALTDIPNRRCFDYQMNMEWGRAIREKISVSILVIDIDKFKDFNDTYGHAHGDKVLKSVAGVISGTLKRSVDFAARWGGEEFSVLLPNTDLSGALGVAEQIRLNIEKLNVLYNDSKSTKVTVSIGVNSETPNINNSLDEFISKADKALYCAKDAGRNTVCPNTREFEKKSS